MTIENNCFTCDGHEYRKNNCNCYAVNSDKDRICAYRKIADKDLYRLENNIPKITLYHSMKSYFYLISDKAQINKLEELVARFRKS